MVRGVGIFVFIKSDFMRQFFFFIISLICFCSSCKKSAPPTVIADFSYTLDPATLGLVHFTNLSKNADSYDWQFGDYAFGGGESKDMSPDFTFQANGTYKVILQSNCSSCAKYTETQQNIIVTNAAYFTAVQEGAASTDYVAQEISATASADLITIKAKASGLPLTITLPANVAVGTYSISNPAVSFEFVNMSSSTSETYYASSGYGGSGGTVVITSVTKKQVTGAFSCVVVNSIGHQFSFTDGKFYVILM
jgi:PKD repeat protein